MKQTCDDTQYCIINRTKLRQTGNACDQVCPVCGKLYSDPGPTQAEINQRYLDGIGGGA